MYSHTSFCDINLIGRGKKIPAEHALKAQRHQYPALVKTKGYIENGTENPENTRMPLSKSNGLSILGTLCSISASAPPKKNTGGV